MKRLSIVMLLFAGVTFTSCAQVNWNKVKKQAESTVGEYTGTSSSKLSNEEVIAGLKEALTIGSDNSAKGASKTDGYWKNSKIRIPFPEEAEKVKKTALDLGMKSQVDKFELTLNRAAEEAAKEAAPIFKQAVKEMTIADGFNILNGPDNAATKYLRDKTTAQLEVKFRPIVKRAINKVELTKYWNPIITAYNNVPLTEKMDPDLEAYVTKKAIEGLFVLIAEEEKKIRTDPLARVTDILKKVFGNNK